ncbi:MAG TPA: DUF3108 domain-containing protein [Rubrivivax sp.]
MRRRVEAGCVAAGVLALHALLLDDAGTGAVEAPPVVVPMAAVHRTVQTASVEAPLPLRLQVPAGEPVAPSPAAPATVLAAPRAAKAMSASSVALAAVPTPAPTTPDDGGAEPPVYPTRIAAPVHLDYEVRRGALTGRAQLDWAHDGLEYTLSLSAQVSGLDLPGQASRGVFDAAGLAPVRFVDRRRGRDRHAANFDREAGRISFSGPATTYPLVPGAQDRLSWMLQLPAIVDADPARWAAGSQVTMFVAGARGDAEAWAFSVRGVEAAVLPSGASVQALHLVREPRRPYDTRVEVWLDPARQHLPLRARMTTLPGGEALELTLAP